MHNCRICLRVFEVVGKMYDDIRNLPLYCIFRSTALYSNVLAELHDIFSKFPDLIKYTFFQSTSRKKNIQVKNMTKISHALHNTVLHNANFNSKWISTAILEKRLVDTSSFNWNLIPDYKLQLAISGP